MGLYYWKSWIFSGGKVFTPAAPKNAPDRVTNGATAASKTPVDEEAQTKRLLPRKARIRAKSFLLI
jgi:hypothetical protein